MWDSSCYSHLQLKTKALATNNFIAITKFKMALSVKLTKDTVQISTLPKKKGLPATIP
jgi:hypothetical protein